MDVVETRPDQCERDRGWWALTRRSAVVVATATALIGGAVQGTAHAAPNPHSEPFFVSEFARPVDGKGCEVGTVIRIDASSVQEARNIAARLQQNNGEDQRITINTTFRGSTFSDVFDVTASSFVRGVARAECTTSHYQQHRGRNLAELSPALRGVVAAAAATAVYLGITAFAVAAAAAVTGGTGSVAAAVVGGCIGGAASTYLSFAIAGGVARDTVIGATIAQCVLGGTTAGVAGPGLRRLEQWVAENQTIAAVRGRVVGWMTERVLGGAMQQTRVAIQLARQRLRV